MMIFWLRVCGENVHIIRHFQPHLTSFFNDYLQQENTITRHVEIDNNVLQPGS